MTKKAKEYARLDDPLDNRRSRVPGLSSVKLATEGSGGVGHQALPAANATDSYKGCFSARLPHRIGAWNVRGLLKPGKIETVEKEMVAHKITILGLSETHLKGSGHYLTEEGSTFYFSGHDTKSINGVGFLVPRSVNNSVMGYNTINDRIMTIKLNCKPLPINIVQIYAPTEDPKNKEDIDNFYNTLEQTLKAIPRREMLFVQGDWNAQVGDTSGDDHIRDTIGKYGLGKRSPRGERFIEFCIEHKLAITNTFFQNHKRRLYTWKSPGDRCRNQIDYITVDQRWRSSIVNAKTFPGADCNSDHNLLVAEVRLRLRSPRQFVRKPARLLKTEVDHFKTLTETAFEEQAERTESVEQQWRSFKVSLANAFESVKRNRKTQDTKKKWMSDEAWSTIEQRKQLKTRSAADGNEYSELSKTIQKLCRRDKNNYLADICTEIEQHAEKYQTADLFKKVREITRQVKSQSWVVEDKEGNVVSEVVKVAERWREYCADLYKTDRSTNIPITSDGSWDTVGELEPDILLSEVESAIKKLKPNKAAGSDSITAEVLKALGGRGMSKLLDICNAVWRTGQWPEDWTHSAILPLHKKGATRKCDNYRTIALISHTSKVLLHIINSRLRHFLDWQIPQEQAGFVRGKGTREQILNVRLIVEKCYEFNTPAVMCFVDYQKAFDCVSWNHLWHVLGEMGVPRHLILLIQNLYISGCGSVKIGATTSSAFKFEKGVRQGCIISPILFNIYGEHIMRKTLDGWDGGVTVGGMKISNLRYADDTTLLTSSEPEMAELLRRLEAVSLECGLKINCAKTKIMIVDRANVLQGSPELRGYDIVENFTYLGSAIANKGGSELEIRRRIGMAKSAMSQLDKIWRDRNILKKTKVYMVKTLVFPIFLYGSESWALKETDRRRVDAFEMWCWRRMLLIPWTAFRTNASILEELKIKQRMSAVCLKRILQYFGHIARKPADNLEKLIVTGKMAGTRSRGRSPTRWSDQVAEHFGSNVSTAIHEATDRHKWRRIVHGVVSRDHHDAQH